jgi:hypothetical protein
MLSHAYIVNLVINANQLERACEVNTRNVFAQCKKRGWNWLGINSTFHNSIYFKTSQRIFTFHYLSQNEAKCIRLYDPQTAFNVNIFSWSIY